MDIAASLIVGILLGVLGSYCYSWLTRPRVQFLGFTSVAFRAENGAPRPGTLHKVVFEIEGRSPGSSCMEIRWPSPRDRPYERQFAKWDETANPVDADGTFLQWLPTLGYHQPLIPGRVYSVPIIFEDEEGLEVFSGFWFGSHLGYLPIRRLERDTCLTLVLSGADLVWRRELTPSDLVDGEPRIASPPR
jgi:hypothetical protein